MKFVGRSHSSRASRRDTTAIYILHIRYKVHPQKKGQQGLTGRREGAKTSIRCDSMSNTTACSNATSKSAYREQCDEQMATKRSRNSSGGGGDSSSSSSSSNRNSIGGADGLGHDLRSYQYRRHHRNQHHHQQLHHHHRQLHPQ